MATNTTATSQNHNGTGSQNNFAISFSFLANTEVDVTVGGVLKTLGTHYNIVGSEIQFTSGNTPPSGTANVVFTRDTNISAKKVDFSDGSVLTETDLDNNSDQILFAQQEIINDFVKRDGSTTVTGNLVFEGATDDGNETTLAITDPTGDRTITVPDRSGTLITSGDTGTVTSTMIADGTVDTADIKDNAIRTAKIFDGQITTGKIADGAVTTARIGDNAITTAKIFDGQVTEAKIADGAVTVNRIGADAVNGAKIADDSIDSEHYVDGSIDTAHIGDSQVTTAKIADDAIQTVKIASNAVTEPKIAANAVSSDKIVTGAITAPKLATNAVTTDKIADAELTTLAGMQSATASKLADSTALTADIADLNQIDGLTKQTTISDTDASFPTSGAVVDFVAAQLAPIGGLEVIATDAAFPNTQPQAGVVISIADAGGLVVNGSGTSTTGRTVGGSTITINNINSSFNNSTVTAGVGFLVSSTGSGQIYNFHKSVIRDQDILSISTDINDFANRYRVTDGEPSSNNDEGDLIYDRQADKMKVFDSTTNGFKEVTSVGDFKFLFLCPAGGTGSPTFNGSIATYDLRETSNSGSAASVTSAAQLLVSVNGVVQKPNTGTSAPSEGFAMVDNNTIVFGSNLPSAAEVFVIQIGSAVSLQVPADNTVSSAKIQNGSVTTVKIADANVTTAKIADQAVTLAKLEHGTSSNDGKFLRANNGADPTFETISFQSLQAPNGQTRILVDNTDINIGYAPLKFDTDSNNTFSIKVQGPTTLTKDSSFTLPEDGSNGQFLKTNGSGVLSFGTVNTDVVSDTSPQLGGNLDVNTKNIVLADSGGSNDDRIVFGAGTDLSIYHDGTNSFILNTTGILVNRSDRIKLQDYTNGHDYITCEADAAVELYYDNSKKFETTSAGFKTQGSGQVDVLIGSTNGSGAFLILDGDANGDGSGGDYSYLAMTTSGELDLVNNKNEDLRFGNNGTIRARFTTSGHFVPQANNTYDLGSTGARWQNIYTNDLNLSNEGGSNDVDGTWGSYTIQEGAEDLFLINKRNGKKYKFNLMEVN